MGVTIMVLERRRDGKTYPAGGVLPAQERNRARWLVHALVCRDHLSIRRAQAILLDQHAIRRSVGSIHRDLVAYQCPDCADRDG